MKGLSIKKVVAVGIGAALIGSALAPIVSAANMTPTGLDDLTVDDVVSSAGVPVVDVVVGSNAAVSDVVWAGNIAARVAQLATTAVGGEDGATSVDVTVGGVQTTTGSGNTDENTMSFTANVKEFNVLKADYSDSAQFANIQGRTIKNNATESQINIDENVEVVANVDFQYDAAGVAPGDPVAKVSSNGMVYALNLGTGIPTYNGMTQLDANANYNVKIPVLGTEYVVDEATSTKLVLYADTSPTDLTAGEIVSVPGVGDYDGKTLTIEFQGLTLASAAGSYKAKWVLMDGSTALKTVEAVPAYDLKDQFGSSYFTESVYVSSAGVKVASGAEYATIRTGTQRLEIRDGEVFPYDSTQTLNPEWTADIVYSGSALNGSSDRISKVLIKNGWSFDQVRDDSTSDTAQLALGPGDKINLPLDYAMFEYKGPQVKTTANFELGAEKMTITDSKGVSREIPMVISLSGTGKKTFTIAGSTYFMDINGTSTKVRYWRKPTSAVSAPYNNPSGTLDSDYFDVEYTTLDVNTQTAVEFEIDADWKSGNVDYYVAADGTNNRYWLLLAAQEFDLDSKSDTIQDEVLFMGTEVDQNVLNGDASADDSTAVEVVYRADLNYYLPDRSVFNTLTAERANTTDVALGTATDTNGPSRVIGGTQVGMFRAPNEGDDYQYVSVWHLNEGSTSSPDTSDINFYVNNQTGYLVNSQDNKAQFSGADYEVAHAAWTNQLNEYSTSASAKLMKGTTVYGTTVEVLDGVATVVMPEEARKVEGYVGSTDTVTTTVGGEDFEGVVAGETVTTAAGTEVTIGGITAPSGNGVAVVPAGDLVKVDTAFSNGKSIIVGGWVANTAAVNLEVAGGQTLDQMLITDGDYVAAELASGNIVAAGMTAADTGAAAQELIDALDVMLG
jgi:hypothetical protein